MDPTQSSNRIKSFAALRNLVRPAEPPERCDLCNTGIRVDHHHLLNTDSRRLVCVCQSCDLLLTDPSSSYKRVPRRVTLLSDYQLSDAQWDSLQIPINLAFFFKSSKTGRIATIYPSPAGPTESLLDPGWDSTSRNPILDSLEPDVEGLLVNRVGENRQYFIAPIDACYELVGVIRSHWRGLSGGKEMWREVDGFFERLNKRSANADFSQVRKNPQRR